MEHLVKDSTNINRFENAADIVCDISTLTRPEWLAKRKTGIGGSDLPVILGLSKWSNPLKLWEDKTSATIETERPENWLKLEYGNVMEPLLKEWYAFKSGFTVVNDTNMYRSKEWPFMIADLDAIAIKSDGEVIGVEIKTTNPNVLRREWATGIYGLGGRLPENYIWQGRHYMAVTGLDKIVFICGADNDDSSYAVVQLLREETSEKALIEAERTFWECVTSRTEPEVSRLSDDDTKEMLHSMEWETPDEIAFSEEVRPLLEKYMELSSSKSSHDEQSKLLKAQMNALGIKIAELMDGHELAVLSKDAESFYQAKFRVSTERRVDTEKMKKEFGKDYGPYGKDSERTSFTISVKEKKEVKK